MRAEEGYFGGGGGALEHRWGGRRREPFTATSPSHVSVHVKP